jgi:hypothetical protein
LKKLFIGACACMLILTMYSCSTTPKKGLEQPQPPAVTGQAEGQAKAPAETGAAEKPAVAVAPAEPLPEALQQEAKALRSRIFSLTLNEVLKDDFSKADAFFLQGGTTYSKDNLASRTAYTEAVSEFNALIEKGLPILAENHKASADRMKEAAVKANADSLFPDGFGVAQGAYEGAQATMDSRDFEKSIAEFDSASQLYQLLYKGTRAKAMQGTIADRNYSVYEPGNFKLAEAAYASATEMFNVDNAKAISASDEALLRYTIVITKGRELFAGERKSLADDSMRQSKEMKANVAVKEDFEKANDVYKQAIEDQSKDDLESAADRFGEAAQLFNETYAEAKEKHDRAYEAMQAAQASKAESESMAQEADITIGTTAADGSGN